MSWSFVPGSRRVSHYAVLTSLFLVASGLVLVSVGCGGSSSNGTSTGLPPVADDGEGITQVSGPFTTRAVGTVQDPVSSGSSKTVVSGFAGASYSSILFNRAAVPNLNNTKIVYSSSVDGSSIQIYTISPNGGVPVALTAGAPSKFSPRLSPDGTKIAYFALDVNNFYQIYVIPASGGTPKAITAGNVDKMNPSWSPDGSKLAFVSIYTGVQQIFTVAATGGATTKITSGAFKKETPTWSPDGTTIAYYGPDANGVDQIGTISLVAGSVETPLTSGSPDKDGVDWSPDGTKLAFSRADANGVSQIYTIPSTGGALSQITTGNSAKSFPRWSPDGTQFVYYNLDANLKYELYKVSSLGGTSTALTNGTVGSYDPQWSGYLPSNPVTIVGTNGLLGTGAAGYLYGQAGDAINSILTFETGAASVESRSAARVINNTNIETAVPNLLFSISSADRLSSIKYINYDAAGAGAITPITPANSITNAYISFNAATGRVSMVSTYSAARSQSISDRNQPTVTHEGNTVVLHGHFADVYNADGKNVSSQGASTIRINEKTGELVSVQ